MNVAKLPDHIVQALQNRGHSREDISQMSPEEAFYEFCNWRGLTNWGDTLWNAVQACQAAAVR